MRPSDPLTTGQILDDRYRVENLIARGGMATVFLARDLRLDRPVALKVMHPVLADDPDFVRRFVEEARSAARLSHPSVVGVYDQGTADGLVYLAMEYVPGSNLRDVLAQRGRLGVGESLDMVMEVLAALTAAHEAGLAHRDIKPENILVAGDGTVKVADFGLARAISTGTRSAATAGLLMGTVAYLAPEQVEHGVANVGTDIYSVGIVLFECLTGNPPFTGQTPLSVAYQHVHGQIPAPSELRPEVPAQVDQLVARATAREPANRFRHVREFSAELHEARALIGPDEPEPGKSTHATVILDLSERSRHLSAHTTAAIAVSTGAAFIGGRPGEPMPEPFDLDAMGAAGSAIGSASDSEPNGPDQQIAGLPPEDTPGSDDLLEGPPARHRGLWAALILIVLAVLAGGGGWAWGATQYTEVPTLIGMSREQAASDLQPLGLSLEIDGEQFSEDIATGAIVATDPEPMGRARNNSVVHSWISKGPERYQVPALRGMTIEEAAGTLAAETLRVGSVSEQHSDKVPEGRITKMDPAPGTRVKRETPIDIVVSKGPAPVAMPKVAGLSTAKATKALDAAGLLINRTEEYSDSVPADTVIRSTPTTGTMIHRQDTVAIVVSKGPPPVPVPDVVRLGTAEAKAKLQAAGFHVVVRNQLPVVMFNRVYSQYPGGGSQAPRGSTITINIV